MSDQRRWQLDLFAGLLLLAGLLLSLSVFTHDPAGNGTVYPPESEPRNFLGPVGAWVGETLLATFGIAGKGVVDDGNFCPSALLAALEVVVSEGVSGLSSSPAVLA